MKNLSFKMFVKVDVIFFLAFFYYASGNVNTAKIDIESVNLTTNNDTYLYYPIENIQYGNDFFLQFEVKADRDAYIIFSSTKNPDNFFKVFFGNDQNRYYVIRTTNDKQAECNEYETNVLSPNEWRQFWIRVTSDGSFIEVGKNGSPAFMSLKTEPKPIKYFGFASWQTTADWKFLNLEKDLEHRRLTTTNDRYLYYPIEDIKEGNDFFLQFEVKAERDAYIVFSSSKNQDNFFKVFFGNEQNKYYVIRTTNDKEAERNIYEKDVLSSKEWRQFWIRITSNGSFIEVGKKDSPAFMSLKTEPKPIKYFGFASWQTTADWKFLSLQKASKGGRFV